MLSWQLTFTEKKTFSMKVRNISIRNYLVLMNLVLLCLLYPLFAAIFIEKNTTFRDKQLQSNIIAMQKSMESRGTSLARSIALSAGQAVAGYDLTFLSDLLAEVVKSDPEIIYCLAMDQERLVLAHPDKDKLGSRLADKLAWESAELLREDFPKTFLPEHAVKVSFLKEKDTQGKTTVLEAVIPIYNGDQLWGAVRCGYTMRFLDEQIAHEYHSWEHQINEMKMYFFTIMAIFFTVGALVTILFTRSFLRAFDILGRGVHRVRDGDLDHEIKKNFIWNEFIDLADAFNRMTSSLRKSRQQLGDYSKSLEDKVTERTRKLKEAQDIMFKQAHEAGMAEMAVGVLHNIGNAITPAKISATMLITRLKNSPLHTDIHQAIQPLQTILEARKNTLRNEQRLRMQKIITLIPGSISEEYEQIIVELEHICDKHAHIEHIIRLQMQYARLMGEAQDVDITRVAQDALNMLEDSLRRRRIDVQTDFQKVPMVRAEESHLLQILVNLIKNGYEAIDKSGMEVKKISVSIFLKDSEPNNVILSIKDSGCGFMPNERKYFFQFGYSTKARGSGFGLHSCANYLIANNGSIDAVSAGLGKGAEFIIRLPTDGSPIKRMEKFIGDDGQ
ncbi:MAG: HAMP domain-containing protein [Candidatus Electrothrix sp. AR4]|nr:HAMP domain-containing protein [Candidatus Electrothrix sp. AR4]